MHLGYNTNGFAHHSLEDALPILADFGFTSVALTLDHGALNPFDTGLRWQLRQIRLLLQRLKLRSVVETGARFLLDPWRKHRPTLVDPPRQAATRLDFLRRTIDIAREFVPTPSPWSAATEPWYARAHKVSCLLACCRACRLCRPAVCFGLRAGAGGCSSTRCRFMANCIADWGILLLA